MANQAIIVIAFALVTSSAHADSCMAATANTKKLKAMLTNQYCGTGKTGNCLTCCEFIPNLCVSVKNSNCLPTHYRDPTKESVAATTANFQTKCCTPKKKCDIPCPVFQEVTGQDQKLQKIFLKEKPGKDDKTCDRAECQLTECCMTDFEKCKHFTVSKPNLVCENSHYRDESKDGETVTSEAEFQTKCCTPKKKCDMPCPVFQEVAGMKQFYKERPGKDDITCDKAKCQITECCVQDMEKCKHFTVSKPKLVCENTHYRDESKDGETVTSEAEFQTKCCTQKKLCDYPCESNFATFKSNSHAKYCEGSTCRRDECCNDDTSKCFSAAGKCKESHYKDESKFGVTVNYNAYEHDCCTEKKKCDITCPETTRDTPDSKLCKTGTCQVGECCEASTNFNKGTCVGAALLNRECSAGKMFDNSKALEQPDRNKKNAYTDNCCTSKKTCDEFKASFKVTASSATEQQAFAIPMLMCMGGYLLWSK